MGSPRIQFLLLYASESSLRVRVESESSPFFLSSDLLLCTGLSCEGVPDSLFPGFAGSSIAWLTRWSLLLSVESFFSVRLVSLGFPGLPSVPAKHASTFVGASLVSGFLLSLRSTWLCLRAWSTLILGNPIESGAWVTPFLPFGSASPTFVLLLLIHPSACHSIFILPVAWSNTSCRFSFPVLCFLHWCLLHPMAFFPYFPLVLGLVLG